LSDFDAVSLASIESVKLMSRIDRKYWFHISELNTLLQMALPFYDILEINGIRLMEYQTCYFDTVGNDMYIAHHNRRLPRLKIRQRKYVSTNSSFLEVKFKTNKKVTFKSRIENEIERPVFSADEENFIEQKSPFTGKEIHPVVFNQFQRITLIHKNKLDRCTIDISPTFRNNQNEVYLEELVIFELKKSHSLKSSPMVSFARQLKIRQRGMSKYCTGRALLEPTLKQNAFKSRFRFIHQFIKTQLPPC
jgi:VTC domain